MKEMKKSYETPSLSMIKIASEEIMTASQEEAKDIQVSFDSLWNA